METEIESEHENVESLREIVQYLRDEINEHVDILGADVARETFAREVSWSIVEGLMHRAEVSRMEGRLLEEEACLRVAARLYDIGLQELKQMAERTGKGPLKLIWCEVLPNPLSMGGMTYWILRCFLSIGMVQDLLCESLEEAYQERNECLSRNGFTLDDVGRVQLSLRHMTPDEVLFRRGAFVDENERWWRARLQ